MTTAEINGTAFRRVLTTFMTARGMGAAESEQVKALAERSGIFPGRLLRRMAGKPTYRIVHLHNLADLHGLTEREKIRLAVAYAFGRDAPPRTA